MEHKTQKLLQEINDINDTSYESLHKKALLASKLVTIFLQKEEVIPAYIYAVINIECLREIEVTHLKDAWGDVCNKWDQIISCLPDDHEFIADAYFYGGLAKLVKAGYGEDEELAESIRWLRVSSDLYRCQSQKDILVNAGYSELLVGMAYEKTFNPYLIPYAKQAYENAQDIFYVAGKTSFLVDVVGAVTLIPLYEMLGEKKMVSKIASALPGIHRENTVGNDVSTNDVLLWSISTILITRAKQQLYSMIPGNDIVSLMNSGISLILRLLNKQDMFDESDHDGANSESDKVKEFTNTSKAMVLYNHGKVLLDTHGKPFAASHLFVRGLIILQQRPDSQVGLTLDIYKAMIQSYESLEWWEDAITAGEELLKVNIVGIEEAPARVQEMVKEVRDYGIKAIDRCKNSLQEIIK